MTFSFHHMHSVLDYLQLGIDAADLTGSPIHYRLWRASDDHELLTDMLHEAYAVLADAGMHYLASHQNSSTTLRRLGRGTTILALEHSVPVGVITLSTLASTRGSPFYDRPDVASFGQFAVRPSHQARGIGSRLLQYVEAVAAESGVAYLALDTAGTATRLISFYEARGFRFVEHVQWSLVNYRSVILAKALNVPGVPTGTMLV
jgi:GNAT superfamily N-acetyltransferase